MGQILGKAVWRKFKQKNNNRNEEAQNYKPKGEKDYGSKCGDNVFSKGKTMAWPWEDCYGGTLISGGLKARRA